MASTTIQFGKANFNKNSNGDTIVWSIQRQVLSLPIARVPSEILVSPNIASASSTIAVPLRGNSTIPASGVYDNLKVIVFKGFKSDYIGTDQTDVNKRWFYRNDSDNDYQTNMSFLCKTNDSDLDVAGFRYGLIDNTMIDDPMALTPLAYFSGSATLAPQENKVITFSNPTFTEAGKKLENWLPSTTSNSDYENKLYVGVYHDSADITWVDSNGVSCDLLWTYPSTTTEQYATLTLNYGAGIIRYHTGSGWIDCEVYHHNGSAWNQCEVNYYDGTSWKTIG